MADITNESGRHRSLTKKSHKKLTSPRVDMTPMVDLGFLLISFFMLTVVIGEEKAMDVKQPKAGDPTDVSECQVLNVLLDTADRVYAYEGLEMANLQQTTLDPENGIRQLILDKSKRVQSTCPATANGGKRQMICLIKLLPGARYGNMVSILDEMEITETAVYAMQEPLPEELEAIKKKELLAEK